MDPAGVPALIAYRGGEKVAALVPLLDDLCDGLDEDEADEDVTVELLENALRRYVQLFFLNKQNTNSDDRHRVLP
jgi:hypothetical protein